MIDQVQAVAPPKRDRGDYFKVYHAKHRDRIIARKRKRYCPHPRSRRSVEEKKELKKERQKSYYAGHKAQCNAATKEWHERNRDAVSIKRKAYRLENKDKLKAMRRRYRQANKAVLYAKHREYRAEHPEVFKRALKKHFAKKRATPKGSLDLRMSSAIGMALRKNKAGRKWETLVGYGVEELHRRIESQFSSGMNWARFLAGEIQIDHIIPIVKFTYSSAEDIQFRRCWALENLQPKWTLDNRRKKDRLEKHEQIPIGI